LPHLPGRFAVRQAAPYNKCEGDPPCLQGAPWLRAANRPPYFRPNRGRVVRVARLARIGRLLRGLDRSPGDNPKPVSWLGPAIEGPCYGPNRGCVVGVVRFVTQGRLTRAAARNGGHVPAPTRSQSRGSVRQTTPRISARTEVASCRSCQACGMVRSTGTTQLVGCIPHGPASTPPRSGRSGMCSPIWSHTAFR
jgi:hypothetical protein